MKTLKMILLFILIELFSLSIYSCRNGNEVRDATRSILSGIPISNHTKLLLSSVEAAYKVPLELITSDTMPQNKCGYSKLEEGVPRIYINVGCDDLETTIFHELYHLLLISEGYPVLQYSLNGELVPHNNFTDFIHANIFDPIMHRIFFDKMRMIGMEPDKAQKSCILQTIAITEPTLDNNLNNATVMIFKCKLEIKDPNILDKLFRWFQIHNLKKQLQKGMELSNLFINDQQFRSYEDDVKMYITCLNSIYSNKLRFELLNQSKTSIGNIQENIFTIDYKALNQ